MIGESIEPVVEPDGTAELAVVAKGSGDGVVAQTAELLERTFRPGQLLITGEVVDGVAHPFEDLIGHGTERSAHWWPPSPRGTILTMLVRCSRKRLRSTGCKPSLSS